MFLLLFTATSIVNDTYCQTSKRLILWQVSEAAERLLLFLRRMEVLSICDVLMQVTHDLAKERVLHQMWKEHEHNQIENTKLKKLISNKESVLKAEDDAKKEENAVHERNVVRLIEKNSTEIRAKM